MDLIMYTHIYKILSLISSSQIINLQYVFENCTSLFFYSLSLSESFLIKGKSYLIKGRIDETCWMQSILDGSVTPATFNLFPKCTPGNFASHVSGITVLSFRDNCMRAKKQYIRSSLSGCLSLICSFSNRVWRTAENLFAVWNIDGYIILHLQSQNAIKWRWEESREWKKHERREGCISR